MLRDKWALFKLLFWKTQNVHGLMASLRGPDCGHYAFEGPEWETARAFYDLKLLVTMRLRFIVFPRFSLNEPHPLTPEGYARVCQILERLKDSDDSHHFVGHLGLGVWATQRHPVWGGLGRTLASNLFAVTHIRPPVG